MTSSVVPLFPASSSIHACIIGNNRLVNLYLAERVRKDPDLRCMSFQDLLATTFRNTLVHHFCIRCD